MSQAQSDNLKRWYVYTDRGRKAVWEETAEAAEAKAEARGYIVVKVEPAPGLGE